MLYFDTSFLAPVILEEPTSARVEAFIARMPAGRLFVSHWTRTEFASLLSREVRMKALTTDEALAAIDQFDSMVAESFKVLVPGVADFELATRYLQHFPAKLRAGDALHLAIASNHGAKMIYALDQGLIAAARVLKVKASRGIKP